MSEEICKGAVIVNTLGTIEEILDEHELNAMRCSDTSMYDVWQTIDQQSVKNR